MPSLKKIVTVPLSFRGVSRRNRDLGFILKMSNFLASSHTFNEVLREGLTKVMRYFRMERGRVYIYDPDKNLLVLHTSRGIDAQGLERMSLDEGFTGKAAITRCFLAQKVTDMDNRERSEKLASLGIKSLVCLPLLAGDRLLGVINLGAKKTIELDPETTDLMVVVGNILALAALNAKYAEELRAQAQVHKEQREATQFFAQTAARDLRIPSIALRGLTRLLMRGGSNSQDEKRMEVCSLIESTASHIEELAQAVDSYVAVKESPLKLEEFFMEEALEGVRRKFSDAFSERGIAWSGPEALPCIRADRQAVVRVFENLVENALKYGGEVLKNIRLDYLDVEDRHVFSVSDDGAGLSEGQAATVFNLFSRAETSQGLPGTGLGLAIVETTAERHGGRAWLESRPGLGCTFYFSLAKNPD